MKSRAKHLFIFFLLIALPFSFSCKKAEEPVKKVEDPFLWLEEVEGLKALDWVRAENDRSLQRLTEDPRFEALYQEGLEDLTRTDRLPGVTVIGKHTYDLLQDAEHVRGLWRRTSLESFLGGEPEWEPVLDIDKLAEALDIAVEIVQNAVKDKRRLRGLLRGEVVQPAFKRF